MYYKWKMNRKMTKMMTKMMIDMRETGYWETQGALTLIADIRG